MLAKPTNKKILSFPKGTILSLVISLCVCVFVSFAVNFSVCVLLSSGGCEITQLYYLGHHMTVSADSFPQKLKKKNNEYLLICMGRGGGQICLDVGSCERTDL